MLRISKLTDYGIVLLTHFAHGPDEPMPSLTAQSLSKEAKLPLPTVGKILKNLSHAGILTSQRGVKGGYQLSRKPSEISIARVIQALEGSLSVTECTTEPGSCEHEPFCPVKSNWQKINGVVLKALEGLTLADMGRPFPKAFSGFKGAFSLPALSGSTKLTAGKAEGPVLGGSTKLAARRQP